MQRIGCHCVTASHASSTAPPQYSVSGSVLHCFALAWFLLPPTTPFYLKRLSSHQHHSDSKSDWGFAPYNIPLSSVNRANGWPGILCLDNTWIHKDEALLSIIKKGYNRSSEACIWSKLEYLHSGLWRFMVFWCDSRILRQLLIQMLLWKDSDTLLSKYW